jgi:prepilin-type N-terminal cleavage/methylation domain-containing protein
MRKAGFTLIELLVVIAIIAMLAAFIFPVFVQARTAVQIMGVGRAGKQIYTATSLYQADYDDTFPLALYWDGFKYQTWFGTQKQGQTYDSTKGFLAPYKKGILGSDPSLVAQDLMGDDLGIGYNWGVIGSDFHETGNYSQFPNCTGAANSSVLTDTSKTVVFATSAFYSVPWLGGDGKKNKFNFFDPMEFWNGNPNVDFRHRDIPKLDTQTQRVTSKGSATFIFADGNTRNLKQDQLKADWFWRYPLNQ